MLQALTGAGIQPDFVVGTSAGAINAAWLAGRDRTRDLDELERVWLGIRREDIFPFSPRGSLSALMGRRNHLVPVSGLRSLLEREIRFRRLEDAALPVHVVAVNLLTGRQVLISRGDSIEALLATTALPGIFPPVLTVAGPLVDGGVANNTPISHAVDLGADRIYVLPSGYACALASPPSSPIAVALHALTLSMQQQLIVDVERFAPYVELIVVPPLCPLDVSPADFSRSGELVSRAQRATRQWLKNPQRLTSDDHQLGLHEHRLNRRPAAAATAAPTIP
jgi:NTE family protein